MQSAMTLLVVLEQCQLTQFSSHIVLHSILHNNVYIPLENCMYNNAFGMLFRLITR